MSYVLYVVGFVTIGGGLICAAVLLHVPTQWIVMGSVVLLGTAIVADVKATLHKDLSK